MRVVLTMCVFVMAIAGCSGGVNCSDKHPGPGCWEADQKRQREGREDNARECKELGLVYVDGATKALGCREDKHQCEMTEPGVSAGCAGQDWICSLDDARVCVGRMSGFGPSSTVPSYCAKCADKALMDKQLAPQRARAAEFAAWKDREATIGDGEIAAKACTPQHRAALEAARTKMEAEFAGTVVKQRGELVASSKPGAPLPLKIEQGGTWDIMVVSTLAVDLDAPKQSRGDNSRAEMTPDSRFNMWKVRVIAEDGLAQTWTVNARGCVLWSLLFQQ